MIPAYWLCRGSEQHAQKTLPEEVDRAIFSEMRWRSVEANSESKRERERVRKDVGIDRRAACESFMLELKFSFVKVKI